MSQRIGISLSGGGYRATAFHLGTLNKLQELGILQKAGIISTISGGSITGACYSLSEGDYDSFAKELREKLQTKNVIRKVLLSFCTLQLLVFLLAFLIPAFYFLFTPCAWLFPVLLAAMIFLLLKLQFYIFPVSKRIEKIYNDFFYDNKTLDQLREKPLLVMSATNLSTARPFTFARDRMQDATYRYMQPPVLFRHGRFPVARAVMASTCVPFAFTPVHIATEYFETPEQAKIIHPVLVDGGVYDNQGIHKIVQQGRYQCHYIITSDAGGGAAEKIHFKNTISLLMATVDVFMARIKKVQMVQDVYDNAKTAGREIAYLSLAWDAEKCIDGFIVNLQKQNITQTVIDAHNIPAEWVKDPAGHKEELKKLLESNTGYHNIVKPTDEEKTTARKVGTNLTSLSSYQVYCLVKQAECLTELQVKLYTPSLLK